MVRFHGLVLTTAALALVLPSFSVDAAANLKTDWSAYSRRLVIPEVMDATAGGKFEFVIGESVHDWTGDGSVTGRAYGYGLKSSKPTFSGPTIKVKKGVPISVT